MTFPSAPSAIKDIFMLYLKCIKKIRLMRLKIPLFFLFILFSSVLSAQTTDLFRAEYLYLPFSKSSNNLSRYRILLQAPIKTNEEKKNYFVISAEYRYVDINIQDPEDLSVLNGQNLSSQRIESNQINSVQQMDLAFGYTWTNETDWRWGIKAGAKIQSDFEGSLSANDFVYEAAVFAIKDMTDNVQEGNKPYRLIFGLNYSTVPGRWYPLPVINYYREFRPNWTYTLGVPKSNLRYYFSDSRKDAVQVFATLDNIYANLQRNFIPTTDQNPNSDAAASIQQTVGLVGLGYEHFFTEKLVLYAYAAHSVYNDFRLENKKGDKLYKINTENSAYFRTGIKYKF